MWTSIILATSTVIAVSNADLTFHHPIKQDSIKRDFLTCQQTYGGGSITCGDNTSHFCYDPTLEESCCLLDNGYCKQGDFCAPVAGFCCHNGEDPSTCARRLDFSISGDVSSTLFPNMTSAFAAFTSAGWTTSSAPAPSIVQASSLDITQTPPSTTDGSLIPQTSTGLEDALGATQSTPAVPESTSTLTLRTGMLPDFTAPANLTWNPQPGNLEEQGGSMPFTGEGMRAKSDTVMAVGLFMFGTLVMTMGNIIS